MSTKSLAGVFAGSLLMATALTPLRAADMSNERALNPQREPQNWILHHGNYQGHRFSALKEINAETVKNLKPVFTVALSGFQSGGRYAFGNLEATPLVEDGILYVPDGWGSVYAIDVSAGKKGTIKWKMDPGTDRAWAGDVACCGVNNRGVALWKDKVISIALDGRMFAINKATGEVVWEIADPALGETLTIAPLVVRDLAIVGAAGGEFGIRGYIEATDLNTGQPRGAPTPFPAPANPATRPGRTARTAGSTAAARYGKPRPTTPSPTRSIRASAMPDRTGMRNTARATTNGRRAFSRSARTTARSSGVTNTRRTIPSPDYGRRQVKLA
jgi:alcohol dehydrogenase (cytochrome c)